MSELVDQTIAELLANHDHRVRLAVGDRVVAIEDSVALEPAGGGAPTATYDGPLEAVVRLLTGRLSPEHTPADVSVSGHVTLDELRQVFPGTD